MKPHISIILKKEPHKPDVTCLRLSVPDGMIIDVELSQYECQLLICNLAERVKMDMEHKDFAYHTLEDE